LTAVEVKFVLHFSKTHAKNGIRNSKNRRWADVLLSQWILTLSKVYIFSGGRLKVGDRKFTTIKNEYELTFDANSDIKHCPDDSDIKTMNYNFVKISDLAQVEVNSNVDVLAIVRSAGDCSELVSQKMGGKVLYKRDLVLFDESGFEVRLTLWGDRAQVCCHSSADHSWLLLLTQHFQHRRTRHGMTGRL
jgi:ssDNA-binding replication factor A large subunit